MTRFRDQYGYPLWMPLACILVVLFGAGSFVAVFYTMNIRWILLTLAAVIFMGAVARKGG